MKPGCARLDGGRADRREVDIEAQRQHRRCGPTQTHLLHGLEAAAMQQLRLAQLGSASLPHANGSASEPHASVFYAKWRVPLVLAPAPLRHG